MMGACYSKNTTGTRTSGGNKATVQKHRNSDRHGKWNAEMLSSENVPLRENDKSLKQKDESPNMKPPRSSSHDLVCDHILMKQVDYSIAPSDSGIESIGTLHEDAQGSARSKQERDELLKHLDYQNPNICHKCSNLKSHDLSLISDNDILSGPILTEKAIDSQVLEYSSQNKETTTVVGSIKCNLGFKILSDSNKNANATDRSAKKDSSQNHIDNSWQKSDLVKPNSLNKDRNLMVAARSTESSHTASSMNKSKNNVLLIFDEDTNETKAPLAHFDSMDMVLNDSSKDRTFKQQSLLTGMEDSTKTISKCTSHSDDKNYTHTERNQSGTEDGQFEGENENLNHINISGQDSQSHLQQLSTFCQGKTHEEVSSPKLSLNFEEKSTNVPQKFLFPNHEEAKMEASKTSSPCKVKLILVSKKAQANHLEFGISESASEVYNHKRASESFSLNREKDMNPCYAPLVEPLISDSSSDSYVSGTEDDISVDLDNLDRVTSQSNSSIRQFVEGTGDLALPFSAVRPTTLDGVDCVIIPKETYHQLQNDLLLLKQQLLNLSSLMQESDDMELRTNFMGDL